MKTIPVLYLTLLCLIFTSCKHRQEQIDIHDYTGYGFFYFTHEKGDTFELRFIPVENSRDKLTSFHPGLKLETGLCFTCNINDTGLIDKIRCYSKRQPVKESDYSDSYKSITYYTPVFISYKIVDDIRNPDSLKITEESIVKNGKDSVFKTKFIETKKDISKSIQINRVVFLDTSLIKARVTFGLKFNDIRRRLSLPELPADWKYVPSFTVGNTVLWLNWSNKNNSAPFFGGKLVAYTNDDCILSEQNMYSGPIIKGKRLVLFDTYYFRDEPCGKMHSRKYFFSFNANSRRLTEISKYQADSVLKSWGLER
ncbi:MAG: hypothetical protein Q8909_06025 [Bacteroidota bacterium]|nr:hypothetical protein [Bacteroidota bacterium]